MQQTNRGERMDSISLVIDTVKRKLPNTIYNLDEPLKNYTSFKIGGPVRMIIFPENTSCLIEVSTICAEFGINPLIMGNGSNILASDDKLDIVVINTSRINHIEFIGSKPTIRQKYRDIVVESGALLSKIAAFAYENSLTGLEFAQGIPGTLGGAVVMNAGAYGSEMKDVILSTTAYNAKKGEYKLSLKEHEYSYRESCFTGTEDVVISSILRLKKGDKETIKQKMDELGKRRRKSQPLDLPSGGSTFKRPKKGYAAELIEQSGLKGYKIGDAQVSEKHAGFIINRKNAKFKDTIALIEQVQETVLKQTGIKLEPEVKIIK